MSEVISLGVPHQMLVGEYSPAQADEDQALDDITASLEADASLSEGNENLVMLAAHAPESIPTDLELEVLLHRIQETVLQSMLSHSVTSVTAISPDDVIADIGLEDYKDVLVAIKNKIVQFLRWAAKQSATMYKRLSDRLGRLSLRVMYIERKIDASGDNAMPSDTIKLPPTANMLSLLGKPPGNASEVLNSLTKVKWLFTTLHNDYTLFQQTFSRAVDAGNRSDVLQIIQDFLSHLTNRLNTRADPQRNGRQVFNQLPSNYIVEISQGDSFTDCWATINRTEVVNVGGLDTRRPDRASLSRLITDVRNFLKVINELYGKVGGRLTADFRKITRDAESNLNKDSFDARTMDTAINWFTEQQNRLFYRSMMMACATISASLDYCDVALRRAGVGNEALEGVEPNDSHPLSNALAVINNRFDEAYDALGHASVGLAVIGVALESHDFDPDQSLHELLNANLDPLKYNRDSSVWTRFPGYNNNLGGYPESVIDFIKAVHYELSAVADNVNQELQDFLAVVPANNNRVMQANGYHDGGDYVQYLLADGKVPTSAATIVEGARRSTDDIVSVLAAVRDRAAKVNGTFNDDDILVSELYRILTPSAADNISLSGLNAKWGVRRFATQSAYGSITIYHSSIGQMTPCTDPMPLPDSGELCELQETLVKLSGMDNGIIEHWNYLVQMATRARTIQGILCDGMAKQNKGKVDQWMKDGIGYLNMLMSELRWQVRLLHQIVMYRYGLMIGICNYQRHGGV